MTASLIAGAFCWVPETGKTDGVEVLGLLNRALAILPFRDLFQEGDAIKDAVLLIPDIKSSFYAPPLDHDSAEFNKPCACASTNLPLEVPVFNMPFASYALD